MDLLVISSPTQTFKGKLAAPGWRARPVPAMTIPTTRNPCFRLGAH